MKKNTLSPKSIIAILIAAIIALTAFVPVSAYGGRVYVADETDSIPAKELAELNEYAEHASETCGTDILFLLAEDEAAAGDSIVDYMANYPNMGNGESRIFFAIGPDSSWYILCGGNMQNMLTKEQEDALRDAYNGPETYFGGIKAYIDLAESYVFEIYPNDTPVDEGLEGLERLPVKPLSFKYIPISLGIGLVIALIAVSVMKSKLKTVRYKAEANSYVRPGSMNITVSRDLFLYRTVAVSPKPKNNSDSDGGSSTHTSSSGSTHGGGGGSF